MKRLKIQIKIIKINLFAKWMRFKYFLMVRGVI